MSETEVDTNFFYNSMLAKALTQLIPGHERRIVRKWFDLLLEMDQSEEQKFNRNEYMWFILLMLQSHKLKDPFNKAPPQTLPPLKDLVSNKIYEEVLIANDENMSWIDQAGLEHSTEDIAKAEVRASTPANFFNSQPWPCDGVVCYLAAFSDHD